MSGNSNLSSPAFRVSGCRDHHGHDTLGFQGVVEINIGTIEDTMTNSKKSAVSSVKENR